MTGTTRSTVPPGGTTGGSGFRTWAAVIEYDGESFTIIDNESLRLGADTGFLHVRRVFEDSKGRGWIGNNGIGVILRDGDDSITFTQAKGVRRRDHRSGGNMTPQPGDAADGSASVQRQVVRPDPLILSSVNEQIPIIVLKSEFSIVMEQLRGRTQYDICLSKMKSYSVESTRPYR